MTYTPMIQQYLAVKAQYKDAFLFFRLGDFYEMFFEDAEKAAQELEITLTSREGGVESRIPMCGVPYHSVSHYITQLVDKGYKIAICEQVEDPKEAKGVVKREVVQVITPGTVMDGVSVQPNQNNYIAAITSFPDDTYGLAVCDVTTGESRVTLIPDDVQKVMSEVSAFDCKEIVISTQVVEELAEAFQSAFEVTISFEDEEAIPDEFQTIVAPLKQDKLKHTFGRLIQYLIKTQKRSLDHLQTVQIYTIQDYMSLDRNSKRNLELIETIRDKKRHGSLLWLLDKTKTAMGARLLKQWIEKPLIDQEKINHRLESVEVLIDHFFQRETIRDNLTRVYDLERLIGRIAYGNVNARDLIQLKKSLEQVPSIVSTLQDIENDRIQAFARQMDLCTDVLETIDQGISDDPPLSVKDGGIIKDGYNKVLDDYRYISKNGKAWIAELEQSEREATGIKSLKIGYNKVFGYYIEVTKTNLRHLPEGRYERRQTLANAERFVTPELKEKEKMIFEAEEKMVDLEYALFQELREEIKTHSKRLQELARVVSEIDVLQSFASVSEENRYTRPVFSENRTLDIKESRHPVVEKVMKQGLFVANDIYMDKNRELLLITGPNMGGKSTFMRQAALTAIMAQIGCYVPADKAILPIFDQIFTRIGAADDLVSGQSTFMVEMLEAEHALSHATENSMILLDEIGRGTSTYDGIAIAQSIVEYIHHHIKAKTMFSTHYHELTSLEETLPRLKNIHVSAMEEEGRVVFLHKIMNGQADKSYGIHVAELAKLPANLINRAQKILEDLEASYTEPKEPVLAKVSEAKEKEAIKEEAQLSFFSDPPEDNQPTRRKSDMASGSRKAIDEIKELDILSMTPLDAMNKLYELQKVLKKK